MSFIIGFITITSITGIIRRTPQQLLSFGFPYWLLSWTAQTFCLPLAIISAVISIILLPDQPLLTSVVVITAIAFTYLHWRNWRIYFDLHGDVETKINYLSGLNPFRFKKKGVVKLKNIPYSNGDARHLLDIYMPAPGNVNKVNKCQKGRPILLHVPGGAWVTGDKASQIPTLYHLAQQGWICVAMNYRLAPKNPFPAMLHDVLSTTQWLREHARDYGGDSDFIAITGGSAGGHLSSLAALISGNPDRPEEFSYADIKLRAAMPIYGRYDFLDQASSWGRMKAGLTRFFELNVMHCSPEQNRPLWELASPSSMVNKHAPPFYIIHGSHDSLIPIEEARHFYEQLKPLTNSTVRYKELKGMQHAFDIFSTPASDAFAITAETFLTEVYNEYCAS